MYEGFIYEVVATVVLLAWVLFVVLAATRWLYGFMRRRAIPHVKAVYYNRKVIHMAAGGLVALLVPYIYRTPLLPAVLAALLAIMTYIPHRRGKLLEWFQVEENMYEVNFCIMWGLVITASWLIFNNYWYGVIPVAFMSFGDGVTGVVRNMAYGHRTKAWIGNAAMLAVTLPIGALIGLPGILAAIVASIVEHYEIPGLLDDNITVPLSSFATIYLTNTIALL